MSTVDPDTTKTPLRVLFFEDQSADIDLALFSLRSAGFEVCADVATTLEQVAKRAQCGCLDVFHALKKEGVHVPFILLTGSLGDEKAVDCLKEGVADYVLKDRLSRLPVAVHRAPDDKHMREERALEER